MQRVLIRQTSLIFAALLLLFSAAKPSSAQEHPVIHMHSQEGARLFNEGKAASKAGDFATAEKSLRQVLDLSPDIGMVYNELAVVLIKDDKTAEAIPLLEKAITLPEPMPLFYMNLGGALHQGGRTKEAIAAYQKFLTIEPAGPRAERVKSLLLLIDDSNQSGNASVLPSGKDDYLGDATRMGLTRWLSSSMPLKVYIDKSGSSYKPDYELILQKCFADWSEASNGAVKFDFVEANGDVQITCAWSDDPAKEMSASEAGHTAFLKGPHGLSRCDMIYLTRDPSSKNPFTEEERRRVYLHEIGHSLGITGHSQNPDDIMYSGVHMGKTARGLSERDKNTLLALYAVSDEVVLSHARGGLVVRGDPNSPIVIAARLNNEGLKAIQDHDAQKAVEILDPAHKNYPADRAITANLGIALANLAAAAINTRKLEEADKYLGRALPLLKDCPDAKIKAQVQKNYALLLKLQHKPEEAAKYEVENGLK
jgi:tetratricopeptide (TPR) repeat protein